MGASGFRNSWPSMARNSSLRRSASANSSARPRNSPSSRVCSVMSRRVSTTPRISPDVGADGRGPPLDGGLRAPPAEAVAARQGRLPWPPATPAVAGSPGVAVCRHRRRGRPPPRASATLRLSFQPVKAWATAFMKATRPSASVAMTRIADAGQRHAQPLALAGQFLRPALRLLAGPPQPVGQHASPAPSSPNSAMPASSLRSRGTRRPGLMSKKSSARTATAVASRPGLSPP